MKISNISNNIFTNFLPIDKNGREINIYKLNNCQLVGQNNFYPNCLLYSNSNNSLYNPINERTMSLPCEDKINFDFEKKIPSQEEKNSVFYFIYNTDNYYHFIYDTLPYLISYRYLRSKTPNLKILMNYPNHSLNNFYPFVKEFLEILDITDDDIILGDSDTLYKEIFISSSYTHDFDSNLPPREEIYDFYKEIVSIINTKYKDGTEYPNKFYISRRSWKHGDFSNIGTDYTSKRKMINEDELVDYLLDIGYVEIFTEKLSTVDKIKLFSNAKNIIGPIGGGVCNVLFSNENTKLLCIVSPIFLEVNKRFIYSLDKINTEYYKDSFHEDDKEWKKYMRVKTNDDIIGEIEEVYDEDLVIVYSDEFISGWNNQSKLHKKRVRKDECVKLDNGLNSSWLIDLKKLKAKIC